MKKIIISLTFLLAALASYSQNTVNISYLIIDKNSIPETDALVEISNQDKSFEAEGRTNDTGYYHVSLPMDEDLTIIVHRYDTTFDFNQNIPTGNYAEKGNIVSLQTSFTTTSIATYTLPVYFDSNSDVIKDHYKKGIDDLFNELDKNKSMKIEIGAHTDNVGSDTFNQNLSQKRATSIRKYLVSKGINGDRIIAKGYGESKPIGDNNTEEGKAKNRRVEITVISK